MTILVFYLSYLLYIGFGIGDVWGWIDQVLLLFGVLLLVILAAAGVVWLIVLVRRRRD